MFSFLEYVMGEPPLGVLEVEGFKRDQPSGSGGGAEWGRWHDLIDRAVFHVVDEAGND